MPERPAGSASSSQPRKKPAKKAAAKKLAKPKAAEVAAVSEPTPPTAPPTSRFGLWLASGLAVAFAITSIVLALVASSLAADKNELEDGRQEVEQAAGVFMTTFLTYDYRRLDEYRDAVLALSVDPLSSQFESSLEGDLGPSITEFQSTATATVDDVFVGEITDDGTAKAIVIYDRVLESPGAGVTPELDFYAQVDLVRVGGVWKVSNVININLILRGDDVTATTPTTTPTTTTP